VREYELTFIVQPEISDEGCAAIRSRLDAVLERHAALPLLYDDWGKRKLAYEIRKFQKGRYFVLSFLDTGKAVPELERTLRLDDSVLRYLSVLVDEQVKDVEARKVRAAEEARVQEQRRAERAAREAEEARAREEAERAREANGGPRAGEGDEEELPAADEAEEESE
jgi:small subunit ribosomal protein S6